MRNCKKLEMLWIYGRQKDKSQSQFKLSLQIFLHIASNFWFMVPTVAGKAVLVALTYPMILEFLPTLLPRQFCSLLDTVCWQRKTESADTDGETVHFEDEILTKLDEILKNEPWKLGFSRVSNVKKGKKCSVCYISSSLEYSTLLMTFSLLAGHFWEVSSVHFELHDLLCSV